MNLPTTWDEVSISKYKELLNIPQELSTEQKAYRVIAALSDLSIKRVLKLPAQEVINAVKQLQFTNQPPPTKLVEFFELDGIEYGILPNLNQITMGELLDLEEFCADWNSNIHRVMSILYRPVIKKDQLGYQVEDYDSDRSKAAAEKFDSSLAISIVHGASIFFSTIGSVSWISTKTYSTSQNKTRMKISEKQKSSVLSV